MLKFYIGAITMLATVADRVRRDDKGATAVEYGLMVALIAGAIVGVVFTLGTTLQGLFRDVTGAIKGS